MQWFREFRERHDGPLFVAGLLIVVAVLGSIQTAALIVVSIVAPVVICVPVAWWYARRKARGAAGAP